MLVVILFSCTNKSNERIIVSSIKYIANDTLYPMNNIDNMNCSKLSIEFFNKAGINISKYYEIIDETQIDIDKDKIFDSLIVLSPVGKMPSNEFCSREKEANRVLLIKMKNVVYLFDNIIWNKWGIGAHNADNIEEACSEKSAFSLVNYFGQSCFFEYRLCVSLSQSRFVIDSILLRTGCEGKEVTKTIDDFNKPFYIENYRTNIIDSLMQIYSL